MIHSPIFCPSIRGKGVGYSRIPDEQQHLNAVVRIRPKLS
jgi:hypothetical protein